MDGEGETKEDVSLVRAENGTDWNEVAAETIQRFEAGESLNVTVFKALGKEVVSSVKAEEE